MSEDQPPATSLFLQQAIAHHRANEYAEAEANYKALLDTEPGHAVANYNLGILLFQQNRAADSLPYLVSALEADPAQGQYWLSYIDALMHAGRVEEAGRAFELARQYGLQGDKVEALAGRMNLCARGPGDREVDELVALFSQGRYEHAAEAAKRLTEKFPDQGLGWKGLGVAYKELGRNEEALGPMQKAAVLFPSDVEAHYNLGVVLQALGRLDDAEASYRKALEINPDYVDALINRAVLLHESKRSDEAERSLRHALEIAPRNAKAIFNLGNALLELKKLDEAEQIFKSALKLPGSEGEANFGLGRTLKEQGRMDDAAAAYRKALQFNPDNASIHYNLGNLFAQQGRLNMAEEFYRKALQINRNDALAHNNLGIALKEMGRLDEAEASFRQATCVAPDYFEAHVNLGNALKMLDKLGDAEASYRKALKIQPNSSEELINLGNIFLELKKVGEAYTCYQKSLEMDPENAVALANLGTALFTAGQMNEAEKNFKRALNIKPDSAEGHGNFGCALLGMGRLSEAITCFQKALEIKPDYALAHSNMIFTQDMMTNSDTAALQRERKKWDSIHTAHLDQVHTHENEPDPERKLRIGYVSADLSNHAAAKIFGAMLFNYNPIDFEIFSYSNSLIEDEFSHQIQKSVSHWKKIMNLSDDLVADMIRQDGIDILIDLSGHSAGNRLPVFARKPAPIQITAWGWGGGTGMKSMDVYLADPVLVPPEEKCLFAENVRYLPNAVGAYFASGNEFPEVSPLPALKNNFITFGSFNRIAKVSDLAFEAWKKVLLAIPNSKLVLKSGEFNDVVIWENVLRRFALTGIDPARITLKGRSSWQEYMMAYDEIDIALDPFPQSGGVTAMEGLMMGVPMITLRWPTVPGRLASSIMTTLGLTDWIAETSEQYVELAVKKALDLQLLSDLRQKLRESFASSILGDHKTYTSVVEREYRMLWRDWCEKRKKV